MGPKERLPGLCCVYRQFAGSIYQRSKQICSKADSDYFINFVDNFANDVLDLLCSQHTLESQTCKTMVLPKVNITGIERSPSFMPGMLAVLESL